MTASRPESKQDVLLDSLRKFYVHARHLKQLTDVLGCTATSGSGAISLRILDWLVTNYSKKNNIVYFVAGADGTNAAFNMFMEYKSQLKAYSKRYFDPFCRRERLSFTDADGHEFQTTCGQLNFFRWAITNGVVEYGMKNATEIEADMMASIKHRYANTMLQPHAGLGPKPRRKELSRAAIKSCTKTVLHVTVRFS